MSSHGGNCQSADVQDHRRQTGVGYLRRTSVGSSRAILLGDRAVFLRVQNRSYPDVTVESSGNLLLGSGNIRLPSKSTQSVGPLPGIPHHIGPAGDAVTIGVLRVGGSHNRIGRDSFQQTYPHHLRRQAGTAKDIPSQWTEGEIDDLKCRRPQFVFGAVPVGADNVLIGYLQGSFGGHPQDGPILQLVTVHRVRQRGSGDGIFTGNRKPDQKPQMRLFSRGIGRQSSAVQQMTGRTGLCIEERTQPVPCLRGSRSGHPVLGEETVPDLEQPSLFVGQLSSGKAEGVSRHVTSSGVTAQIRINLHMSGTAGAD